MSSLHAVNSSRAIYKKCCTIDHLETLRYNRNGQKPSRPTCQNRIPFEINRDVEPLMDGFDFV